MASNDEWHSILTIEGKAATLKLYTGAKCNVLPKTIYNSLKLSKLIPTNTKLVAYSGETIELLGEVFVNVAYKLESYCLRFYVVDCRTQAILCFKYCEWFNLVHRVQDLNKNCNTEEDFLKKYSDVFTTSEIGCLPGLHHIEINKKVKWVIDTLRQVSATLHPTIKAELHRMEKHWLECPPRHRLLNQISQEYESSYQTRVLSNENHWRGGLMIAQCKSIFHLGCCFWILANSTRWRVRQFNMLRYTVWLLQA